MREIVLYLAMSLDGYIADSNGGVDWLAGEDGDGSEMGSYPAFIQTVDTVLMGHSTYHQITTELLPGDWPYAGIQTYVLTHRQLSDKPGISFTAESIEGLVGRLRRQEGKDIWLCGGANLIRQFIEPDLIDRYHLTVIPTLLGGGVGLFPPGFSAVPLKLLSTATYNGMADLVYAPRARKGRR